uniref:Uncharacterized protein n=1 Tax=Graphocephala atropunctata TaxID=36148 RepID=A0A1B6MIQ3_9HEMI
MFAQTSLISLTVATLFGYGDGTTIERESANGDDSINKDSVGREERSVTLAESGKNLPDDKGVSKSKLLVSRGADDTTKDVAHRRYKPVPTFACRYLRLCGKPALKSHKVNSVIYPASNETITPLQEILK